jgi:4-hydroxy-3-polyprenylbenzoate decarboxylase
MKIKPCRNLGEFVSLLESRGQLRRVSAAVDPELEITEITDRVVKDGGPALLFEDVKGAAMPLVTNLMGTAERMAWALGVDHLDEQAARIAKLVSTEIPSGLAGKIGRLLELARSGRYLPRTVKTAPCQEVVEDDTLDLGKLPVMKCWPEDGGRFITLPLVVTKSPETGRQNVGMYRLQVFDARTTGMHWHRHHDGARFYREACAMGKPLEVAVALGGDPATIYAATAPLPPGLDELIFAGFLRDRAVDVVRCRTVDLLVPAEAEIVLEGYVAPEERRREGPFGDHTGYYSLADDYPVFHVTAVTRRRSPLYPSTIVGRPPMEDCFMGKATERLFLPLVKLVLPEIVDMDLPLEGVFHNCVILSINKEYRGHAQKVMNAVWGMGQMMFSKMVLVVDADVNVHDYSEVTWRAFNNVDPRRDILISEGPLDVLDHSSPMADFGSKIGIDATRKGSDEGHPREWPGDIEMTGKVRRLVDERWKEYGLD